MTEEVTSYAKKIFVLVALLAIGYCAYTLFGSGRGYDNNGERIQQLEERLQSAQADNKRAIAELKPVLTGLAEDIGRIGSIERTIIEVRERNSIDQRLIVETGEIFRRSESTFSAIQERGKTKNKVP